jgi:hypothetical protein
MIFRASLNPCYAAVRFQLTLTLNMPGATVTVFNKSQDLTFRFPLFLSGTANASGVVSFSLLSGTHEVDVTATGFGSVTVDFSISHPCRCLTAHLIGIFTNLACLSCLGKRCSLTNRHRPSKVIASVHSKLQCLSRKGVASLCLLV